MDKYTTRNKLLTTREAAEILNVHENTVRRWCDRGIFTYYQISTRGDRRLSKNEVKAFLKSHIKIGKQLNSN
jgi:excisionase family DNA binding protein